MGAKELQRKLKKKKKKDADSQTMNSNFVQNEGNFHKVTKEKKRKKKKLDMQNRRSKDEIDECHLSYHKDESNNADGEKKKSKSSKQKRKSNTLAESGGANQSNEIEDGIGQENTISSEPGSQETRKSRKKKRKSDKKAGKAEVDGVPKRQRETDDIVEKDHPLSTAKDNIPVEREQAEEEEIYELSSGDEDYSKGMRKWVADYYQSRPGLEVLQERIDEFIIDYEAKKEQEKKEKEALAAEDGWTVVVHHKGRKKNTDSETGIAVEIMVLQSKFEQDKKRIQQLRAARKFRPY